MEAIEVSAEFAVSPARLYQTWLDGSQHGAMTGAVASVEAWVGGQHTAWDGYIWGRNLELEPNRRIVQTWRTTEFPFGSGDSRLEILLEPTALGTRMRLRHTQIPDGQGEMYRDGWEESYFRPMRAYFSVAMPAPAPVVKVATVSKAVKPAKGAARKVSKKATKKVRKKATKKARRKVTKKARRKVTKAVKKKPAKRARSKATKKAAKKTTRKTKRARRR